MDPNNINASSSSNSHHFQGQVWFDSRQSESAVRTRNPTRNFNLNNENVEDEAEEEEEGADDRGSGVDQRRRRESVEKEGMFEKPLTPSDVGKLNRLVIPKQHAEKYFPLGGGGGGDSGEKGLLLSFEDEDGKCWRFRYSYWNSSQSYVLTKGWSRYVKEKQLDAGDVVFFQRHRTDGERFFIGWRRRATAAAAAQDSVGAAQGSAAAEQWTTRVFYPVQHPYPAHHHHHGPNSTTVAVPYQPDCTHAGIGTTVPTGVPAGNLKRLRLFGVNLECQSEEYEPSTPDGSSSVSSQGATHYQQQQQQLQYNYASQAYASNRQNQMERSCSGDVNQQRRNGRG